MEEKKVGYLESVKMLLVETISAIRLSRRTLNYSLSDDKAIVQGMELLASQVHKNERFIKLHEVMNVQKVYDRDYFVTELERKFYRTHYIAKKKLRNTIRKANWQITETLLQMSARKIDFEYCDDSQEKIIKLLNNLEKWDDCGGYKLLKNAGLKPLEIRIFRDQMYLFTEAALYENTMQAKFVWMDLCDMCEMWVDRLPLNIAQKLKFIQLENFNLEKSEYMELIRNWKKRAARVKSQEKKEEYEAKIQEIQAVIAGM